MILTEGQILNDRYQVESLIGQGGMSYVYRAYDQKMGRTIAIKVLKEEYCEDEEFIRKFQNEAQAAAKLNHPNIVAAYDVVDDGKLHYIVMELVEGITLKNYIQRKGKLENKEAIGIALQVVDGMEQAHKMGIVHRDIKPQNMIVGEDGIVKVADFGIARAATQQTVNATVMGSVHYISPEQARTGVSDERSDIYSFGCTMFEMFTGKVPYDGENSVAVVLSHLDGDIPHVSDIQPDVYPALDMAVFKCMQKKPINRYQHIGELGADLRKAMQDPSGSSLDYKLDPHDMDGTGRYRNEENNNEEHHHNRIDRMIEGFYKNKGIDDSELNEKVNHVYHVVSIVSILFLVVLVLMILRSIFGFVLHGSDLTTTAVTEISTEVEETTTEVNITISALESKLPNIIGMTMEEAKTFLADYGITFSTKDAEFSDRYNEGVIISYPSKTYKKGSIIEVVVSKGPLTIDLSNSDSLHGMKFADLEKELKERNVTYETKHEYSDSVIAGNVISSSKPDTRGTEPLIITVSDGKSADRVSVPSIIGYAESDAIDALHAAGLLQGNITYMPSDSVQEGVVMEQSPAGGTIADVNSYVNFSVSAGVDGPASIKAAQGPSGSTNSTKAADAWHGSINQVVFLSGGGPGITGTMLISIRLKQDYDGDTHYTTLQQARSFSLGSELQVIFADIEGHPGVSTGEVEVVDASTDTIIQSFTCSFAG